MPNKVYGIARNRKFEQQLKEAYPGKFTYAEAKQLFYSTRPGDTCFPGMNCTLYLASMVNFALIVRTERGKYEWHEQSRVERIYMEFFENHVIEDRREYDVHELQVSNDLSHAEAQQLYDKVQAFFS